MTLTKDLSDRLDRIAAALRAYRLSVSTEAALQADCAAALAAKGIHAVREYQLNARDRVDLWVPRQDPFGFAIECKISGSPASVARQCVRYVNDLCCEGVVLVTARAALATHLDHMNVPAIVIIRTAAL